MTNFETYLAKFSEADWLAAVDDLLPEIHPVDKDAVQIWFRFFPLDLHRYLESAENREEAIRELLLQGDFELKDQVDTSHHFLYGHRYWKVVKAAIEAEAAVYTEQSPALIEEIRQLGIMVAEKLSIERQMVNAMVAIGLATLNQTGLEAFKAASGETVKPSGIMTKSPNAVIAERQKDDSQGLFGFLRSVDKQFSINFANGRANGKFEIIHDQEIAVASAGKKLGEWQEQDPRCWAGVVPVECLAASCGTCWVGVLGGREKLSDVERRERRAMKLFGYEPGTDEQPLLRLACQAKAYGNATIVIPPWNGVIGKKVRGDVEEIELEPVTTSAKALRETVRSATSGD